MHPETFDLSVPDESYSWNTSTMLFQMIFISNLLILHVRDEGYSRKAPFGIYKMSTY
jgi:hypothetical protein